MPRHSDRVKNSQNKPAKGKVVRQTPKKKQVTKEGKSTKKSNQSKIPVRKSQNDQSETAYERLCRMVEEKRAKEQNKQPIDDMPDASVSMAEQGLSEEESMDFTEEECMVAELPGEEMQMEVGCADLQREFPMEGNDDLNNNATTIRNEEVQMSASGSVCAQGSLRPACFDVNPAIETQPGAAPETDTFSMMQKFMLNKGLINNTMSKDEMINFISKGIEADNAKKASKVRAENKQLPAGPVQSQPKQKKNLASAGRESISSASEITIYKRAVQQLDPNLGAKIEDLLNKSRMEVDKNCGRISFSSDENDNDQVVTSDDSLNSLNRSGVILKEYDDNIVVDMPRGQPDVQPGTSGEGAVMQQQRSNTPEEHIDNVIRDAERSKARIREVPGRNFSVHLIDEDYQMIDAHVDESLKRKIHNFEYVDFSKLIICNRMTREDEGHQRLEVVHRNGYSYLATTSERDTLQITSYARWEQAFRVYSNVITAKFPHKATELLQYNHTVHTAASSYVWENVYAYDKEFRHHISRHVEHPWNVILQQAWTMLLKDRLRNDNTFFQRGNNNRGSKRDAEPCRRFNKGKCTFGLACKFDHRCSVKKCGKFGHGVHICRLHNMEHSAGGPAVSTVPIQATSPATHKIGE